MATMTTLSKIASYPNVMATLAVVLATSAGAYTVARVPNGSVGTAQLKNYAVSTGKVRTSAINSYKVANNSLNSADIRNGSLLTGDFASGQLPAALAGSATAGGSFLDNCRENVLATRQVTPRRTSRMIALTDGYWSRNGNTTLYYDTKSYARVLLGTTEVGRTRGNIVRLAGSDAYASLASVGLVLGNDDRPTVLSRGRTYTVEMVASLYGNCSGQGYASSPQLTTLLTENAG